MVNILAAMNNVFYRSLINVVEKIPWFLTNIILNVSEHRQQEYKWFRYFTQIFNSLMFCFL